MKDHARRGRPVSLRTRLLALVLVPLLGFSAFASVVVTQRVQRVGAAQDAVARLHAAVTLDGLRARIVEEAIPMVSSVELLDLADDGLDRARLAGDLAGLHADATRRTDAALALARAAPLTRAAAREAAGRLAAVRASRAAGATPSQRETSNRQLFDKYRYLVRQLADEVDAHLATAARGGDDEGLEHAVRDLQRTARATTLAGEEVPYYLGLVSAPVGGTGPARSAFLASWSGFGLTAADIGATSRPAVRSAWVSAQAHPDARFVDTTMAAAVAAARVPEEEDGSAPDEAAGGVPDGVPDGAAVPAD
ncbi:hypothetical protein GTQ99_19525 [Kineococcus sp. T13]|uniref:hypothetical protein n=1 Tax=Kineococcus vitellinus TaxID=2696565 RepID=UPI0014126684|nr:hypothetical protein [Kineococcus vitellinus]NAZ77584.1 hypothetical protein [Kineococcus vitellinus]